MAVVLLHPTKALDAAWIAVVVSASPISGIFPSTSLVAGSGERKIRSVNSSHWGKIQTGNNESFATLCIKPSTIDEGLKLDQVGIFQTKLKAKVVE